VELGWAFVDEAAECSMSDWVMVKGRLSWPGIPYHQLTAATNPAGPGHWLKARFTPPSDSRVYLHASTFDNPTLQHFAGPVAPAMHLEGTTYPLVLDPDLASEPLVRGLGLGGSLDYGSTYQIPLNVGGAASSVSAAQMRYDVGAHWLLGLHALGRDLALRAALGFAGRDFRITAAPSLAIPRLTMSAFAASLRLDASLFWRIAGFARATLLLPVAVYTDVGKYGVANASPGVDATMGLAVAPIPWLSIAAGFDVVSQGFLFTKLGGAAERYLGGTVSAAVLY